MLLDKQKCFLYDKITNLKEVLNMKTVKQKGLRNKKDIKISKNDCIFAR